MKETLDDKIMRLSSMASQIGTIAFCAANSSFSPEKCEMILDNVLYGIENLSKQISDELDALSVSLGNVGEVVV